MIVYTFQMKLLIFYVKKHAGEVCIPNCFFKYYNMHTKFMILILFSLLFFYLHFFVKDIVSFLFSTLAYLYHYFLLFS
jgi:hypothetical protein